MVTSIDLDHMDFLGGTREQIGLEKAGIFRAGVPAVVGDPLPPASLLEHAQSVGADLWVSGRDFGFGGDRQQWGYWRRERDGHLVKRAGIAYPALRGANQLLNASAAMTALELLRDLVPVSMGDIRRGLMLVELPGRFQVLPGRPAIVLDVAHNPHAAAVLDDNLSNMGFFPETHAVVGMLGDKDLAGTLKKLAGRVDRWYLASLEGPRAGRAEDLALALDNLGVAGERRCYRDVASALAAARSAVTEADRILVFGSFLTVAGAMQALGLKS